MPVHVHAPEPPGLVVPARQRRIKRGQLLRRVRDTKKVPSLHNNSARPAAPRSYLAHHRRCPATSYRGQNERANMAFDPFDVSVAHIAYAALGGFVVLFGMFSLLLREKLYIGEACWAFLFGVVIGPYGANVFNPHDWAGDNEETVNAVTLEFTRVVLAIGVFAIGVELPKAYMRRHWQSLFFLLGPVMIWGWFAAAGIIFALIPGLNFLSSLAVAACLTPTDPILAAAVVGGKYADKHVPAHIRHLLAAESGCNDGAAFPFLYIALYLILDHSSSEALRDWVLKLWLYQVILGVIIGSLIGWSFRHLMKFSERHSLIDRHSYVAQYISLALLTIGLGTLIGTDDLLSAFSCGAAFAWDGFFNRQTEESVFSSVIDLLFNVAAFVYIGAWMPFGQFSDPEGTTLQVRRLVIIALLVLLFRRLPVVVALYRWIPDIKTFREAVFTGHFGPIGVGAVFISTLAAEALHAYPKSHEDEQTALLLKTIQPICAFMVLCSITVHGLSIPGFSLGRRVHSVSRTWSRHTTATQQVRPEWLDHVRRAESGVVVNRDPRRIGDLEEGVPTPTSSDDPEKDPAAFGPEEQAEEIDVKCPGSESSIVARDEEVRAGVRPEGDLPPDGRSVVAEWQEGRHRVIERRTGPGEEVDVEVIRGPDSDATIHRVVEKLKHAPHALESDLEALGRSLEERVRRSPLPAFHRTRAQVDEEDEQEWASEESEREPSSRRPHLRGKSRLGPGRIGIAGGSNLGGSKGRPKRRGSTGSKNAQPFMRERPPPLRTSAVPMSAAPSQSSSVSSGSRDAALAYPSPIQARTGRFGGSQSRVESLRAAGGTGSVLPSRRQSRDASPARSVRFVSSGSGSGSGRVVALGEEMPAPMDK
ncbi:Na+ H+ exchanger 1 [Mycena kentingensis (nom. inval.)]|nr:Na+ H+ exchanger 1 [Mycena kentingensis (nom. inval.)]